MRFKEGIASDGVVRLLFFSVIFMGVLLVAVYLSYLTGLVVVIEDYGIQQDSEASQNYGGSFSYSNVRFGPSKPSEDYVEPNIYLKFKDSLKIKVSDPVVVKDPGLEGDFGSEFVEWKTLVRVPEGLNGNIILTVSGGEFARIEGPENSETFWLGFPRDEASVFGFVNDLARIEKDFGDRVEIIIESSVPGDYEVYFATYPVYVSRISFEGTDNVKVGVKNPSDVGYSGVSVFVEMPVEIGELVSIFENGVSLESSVYDLEGDGIGDVVGFQSDFPAKSDKEFSISKQFDPNLFDESGIIGLSPGESSFVPEGCDLVCEYGSCDLRFEADKVIGDSVLNSNRQREVVCKYKSESGVACPDYVLRSKVPCVTESKKLDVVPEDVQFSPGTGKSIKSVKLFSPSDQESVGRVSYGEDNKLDIIFGKSDGSQEEGSEGFDDSSLGDSSGDEVFRSAVDESLSFRFSWEVLLLWIFGVLAVGGFVVLVFKFVSDEIG